MKRVLPLLFAAPLLAACASYRPMRFIDRPPVTEVHDDAPSPLPEKGIFIKELAQVDNIRHSLVEGLDPRRTPDALDVNSFDDVPRSSWFLGAMNPSDPLGGYGGDGPPQPPFELVDEPATHPDAYRIRDVRGLDYEMLPDIEGRPGMRTASAAITSRLLHALGYRTPEVHVVLDHERRRVAATRWPLGVDLGPTPMGRQREDDPNDHLPHIDRRSLRSLRMAAAWLQLLHIHPEMLRDAYLGAPGRGHVEHMLLGFEGGLGVQQWQDEIKFAADPDRETPNFFYRVFSLGLSPKPPALVPETPWPSVGLFYDKLQVDRFKLSPPFEPSARMRPGDAYWMAKRLAGLPLTTLSDALQAGKLDPPAINWLFQILCLRRAAVVAWGYDRTTPLEIVTVRPRATGSATLVLADLAIEAHFVSPQRRRYEVLLFDREGHYLTPTRRLRPKGSIVEIVVPRPSADYVVVQVRALVDDHPLPRALEIHLAVGETLRVLGLRH
ncbi:MAG: hypothetical protein R3B72_08695 [Polyangiaceae bacterium]